MIGSDPVPGDTTVELVTLTELAQRSDIISLHCPPKPDGSPLISADLLRETNPGVIVINTARSGLVDATPHLGAFTTASVRNATQMAVKNLLAALEVL